MGTGFLLPVDIANKAGDLLGVRPIVTFTDDVKQARVFNACYDKLRLAELERNLWTSATRKAALRPLETAYNSASSANYENSAGPTQSMKVTPAAYDSTKTYPVGSLVTSGGQVFQARQLVPLATVPGDSTYAYWEIFYGSLIATPWSDPTSSATTAPGGYYAGEVVYVLSGGVATAYLSLLSNNQDNPTTIPAWDTLVTYNKGATVTYSSATYESQIDLNFGNTPTGTGDWTAVPATRAQSLSGPNWLVLGTGLLSSVTLRYPIGAGPQSQTTTRNCYVLPNGHLRKAAQDPRSGSLSYLGAPSGNFYDDFVQEGSLIVTRSVGVLVYRFVADLQDVTQMHAMFCEGLAVRMAIDSCETLTQSTEKMQGLSALYNRFMGDARAVNAIETGTDEPAEDDYISCRI